MSDPSQTTAIQIPAFVKRRALRSALICVAMIGSGFGLFCFMMVMFASELAAEKAVTRGHLQAGQVTMFDVVTVVESLGMIMIYVVMMLIAVPGIFVAFVLRTYLSRAYCYTGRPCPAAYRDRLLRGNSIGGHWRPMQKRQALLGDKYHSGYNPT